MCSQPISIYNNSHILHYGDKVGFQVPCGHCPQCNETSKLNSYIRASYEYEDCISNGGYVLFDTLTFRDADVPLCNGLMVFDKPIVQKFLKVLRINLQRRGYCLKEKPLRYLITCEYGHKGTQRPHYHILFFVYDRCCPLDLLNSLVVKYWHYGRNDIEHSPSSRLLNSPSAVEYVTKYAVKDSSFDYHFLRHNSNIIDCLPNKAALYAEKDYHKAVMSVLNTQSDDNFTSLLISTFRENYERSKPFRLMSQNFGLYLLSSLSLEELKEGRIKIRYYHSTGTISSIVNIPSYYFRKVSYDARKVVDSFDGKTYVEWRLNDLGKELKEYRKYNKDNENRLVTNIEGFASTVALSLALDEQRRQATEILRFGVDRFGALDIAKYILYLDNIYLPTDINDIRFHSLDGLIDYIRQSKGFTALSRHTSYSYRLQVLTAHSLTVKTSIFDELKVCADAYKYLVSADNTDKYNFSILKQSKKILLSYA